MIKAILDTNILASGFVSFNHPNRAPAQILHAWRDGLFELIVSEHILNELEKTFQDPYFQSRLSPEDINEAMILLRDEATVAPITVEVHEVATHPEDDLVLSATLSAKVDYLVTGDGPMLRKVGSSYQGVKLVTPNNFLEILNQ